MPLPSQDQQTPPGLPPALANNPALAAQAQQVISGSYGQPTGIGNGGTTSSSAIMNALIGTSLDVTGRYGLTGQPNYSGPKPAWLQLPPGMYQALQSTNNYDPWFGVISDNGDDRVYMGGAHVTKKKQTREPAGPFMMPAEAGGANTVGPATPTHTDMPDQGVNRTETNQIATDGTLTIQQAVNLPYGWDSKKVAETIKKMNKAGLNVSGFDDMVNVWGNLVARASMMYAYSEGQNKVTPWDVLSMYGKEGVAAGLIGKDGSQISPLAGTTHTSITKTVSDITQGDAWSALQGTLSQLLGRDPTDRETRDFAYRMNSLAAKNPTISKSVTHYDQNGDPTTNTSTKGGFSAQDMAQSAYEQAQQDPNYAEYQSATTYYNAALQALSAIGQVAG